METEHAGQTFGSRRLGGERYTHDSVLRALVHHADRGAIRICDPKGLTGRQAFVVDTRVGTMRLTLPEAYVLVVGLAASERLDYAGGEPDA